MIMWSRAELEPGDGVVDGGVEVTSTSDSIRRSHFGAYAALRLVQPAWKLEQWK